MSDISSEPGRGLGRRQFLHKAALAGGVAWVVPTIVTMQPARAAELTSPPPGGDGGTSDGTTTDGGSTDGPGTTGGGTDGGGSTTGGGTTDGDGTTGGGGTDGGGSTDGGGTTDGSTDGPDVGGIAVPADPADPTVGGTQVAGRFLAQTGPDLEELVVAGLAATVGGAALLLWRADTQQ